MAVIKRSHGVVGCCDGESVDSDYDGDGICGSYGDSGGDSSGVGWCGGGVR
jgi:hypothetical protein